MVKMCDGFIEGLQWCGFITELKQFGITQFAFSKTKTIVRWTGGDIFKNIQPNAFSCLEDPLPGSLTDSDQVL